MKKKNRIKTKKTENEIKADRFFELISNLTQGSLQRCVCVPENRSFLEGINSFLELRKSQGDMVVLAHAYRVFSGFYENYIKTITLEEIDFHLEESKLEWT